MTLKATRDTYNIGYNPKTPLYYSVLGHELMHFAQLYSKIPHGEKACDVFSIARSELFTDYPPSYLSLRNEICNNWSEYAHNVRKLCIKAIEIRENNRFYLKWVIKEINKLVENESKEDVIK